MNQILCYIQLIAKAKEKVNGNDDNNNFKACTIKEEGALSPELPSGERLEAYGVQFVWLLNGAW